MKKRREVRLYEDKSELEIHFINIFQDEIYEKILEYYKYERDKGGMPIVNNIPIYKRILIRKK